MKRLIAVLSLCLCTLSPALAGEAPRVLMVLSGYGLEQGEERPGYEFDEFAQAYLIFRQNGLAVDIASPRGGAVEADKYNPDKSFVKAVTDDAAAMAKLENTLSLDGLKAEDYAAVFVVGGKGAMFDLPEDRNLQRLIAGIYERDGVVAAVCHGPAALVNVKLSDGSYLVSGRAVNGFTNAEERAFGKKWIEHFPFLLQDKLIERGGRFQHSDLMLGHVAADERLLTGQNPSSTPKLAEALVESLGIVSKPREPFVEERTMDLIAEVWGGDAKAGESFRLSAAGYEPKLVSLYGFYQLQFSEDDRQRQKAVALMELGSVHFQHPAVELAMARGHVQLGNRDKARALLTRLLEEHPDMQEARAVLKEL
ncbi:Putative intracellular protease/amidase [Microbulbifer donghaiensis]|uniref:Putative intracellular protease/amidase n=1 Tax=Microbulbifer donghaiensis TaxID=494016 RepID=A0A1M4XZF6_9GAMM|nr:type 1 glutamine amidotransferase domain-containing protein [Microbulbifer donghaiensis]SHE98683.1 Putative intracellular protease/amidase [Microbulbifer donghaiensis]